MGICNLGGRLYAGVCLGIMGLAGFGSGCPIGFQNFGDEGEISYAAFFFFVGPE